MNNNSAITPRTNKLKYWLLLVFSLGVITGQIIEHAHFRFGNERLYLSYNEIKPELIAATEEAEQASDIMSNNDIKRTIGIGLPGPARAAEKHTNVVKKALPVLTTGQ